MLGADCRGGYPQIPSKEYIPLFWNKKKIMIKEKRGELVLRVFILIPGYVKWYRGSTTEGNKKV